MSIIEHCPGENPSADSPGCDEYFVVQCDVCGECWEVGPKSEELEFNRHLCAECEKAEEVADARLCRPRRTMERRAGLA